MKYIITSTNRKGALSLKIAGLVKKKYEDLGARHIEILDLKQVPFKDIVDNPFSKPTFALKKQLNKIAESEALILVCPEYNGGIPGLIKHFIDHWIYPESFVYKPVCFIGVGGKFGALNPILHLESIFTYRHSFVFPLRVLIQNVSEVLKQDEIIDLEIKKLLEKQARNFLKFIKALQTEKFD
ncbi:MAG: NAD(P)H-dependent oxidoreductase [Bdellovibrionales bacterium]|nr:NAD(P)H-dependent oxidoreductase [Bdellovibrionales bacterium]